MPLDHPRTRGAHEPSPATGVVDGGVRIALARLRRATGVSVTFSGQVTETGIMLNRFDGPIVGPLRGARLAAGRGLGGRVVSQGRALAIPDYVRAAGITHEYDEIIRAEALRAMVAAPVVVARRPVAVLYAALRTSQHALDQLLTAVDAEARQLEQELAVQEALRRPHDASQHEPGMPVRRVDEAYARLRSLAATIEDPGLSAQLLETAGLLAPLPSDRATCTAATVTLTPRERDVLALLTAGHSNQDIATHLGVGLHTVKGHLKNLFVKLDATNRVHAVAEARRRLLVN